MYSGRVRRQRDEDPGAEERGGRGHRQGRRDDQPDPGPDDDQGAVQAGGPARAGAGVHDQRGEGGG